VLNINKDTSKVEVVPVNKYVKKEKESVRLFFIDNIIYGDHDY
jgi:hypothetical protein